MRLAASDLQTIGECLKAVALGPFLPDWEFGTLMGMSREELTALAMLWPNVDFRERTVRKAISNSLANLTGYPIDGEERWSEYISISRSALSQVHTRFDDSGAEND